MPLHLHYRQRQPLPLVEPAGWEFPASLSFASVALLRQQADAQGLAEMLYREPHSSFPDGRPGTAYLTADEEELVWELACQQSDDPENAAAWPAGAELPGFLTHWRLGLMEEGSYLELRETPDDTTLYLRASPADAERLRLACEQFDRGERIDFTPPAE